jgi:hypothetical protein
VDIGPSGESTYTGQMPPDDEAGAARELCDLCGAVIADDSQLYALVPDPDRPHEVGLAGQRLVTACCRAHLEELRGRNE